MIKLYQFARIPEVPNQSQFCSKAETYLRMSKLPYEAKDTMPLKAPRGKLPYIDQESRNFCESLFWASKPKQAAKT